MTGLDPNVRYDEILSDVQVETLIRLDGLWDSWVNGGPKAREPWGKPCREARTLTVLAGLELAEIRFRRGSLDLEARITKAGRELVRSMGD